MTQAPVLDPGVPGSGRLTGALAGVPWRYYLGFALSRLATLAILPAVSRLVGVDGFGRFEVAVTILLAAVIVFDAGFGAALIRYARDERFEMASVIAVAGRLQFVAAAVACVLIAPAMLLVAPSGEDLGGLTAILVVFCFVEGFAVFAGGLIRAEGRDGLYLALSVSRLVITVAVGAAGAALIGVPGAVLGIAIGGAGFAAYGVRRWRATTSGSDRSVRAALLRYGVPLIFTTLATWCLALSDRLFLQDAVSAEELGQYSANYRFGSLVLTFLAAPLALAWLPEVQRLAPRDRAARRLTWTKGFSGVCVAASATLVGSCGVAVPLIFGDEFSADRLVVLLVAVSGWLMGVYYLVATPLLTSDSTLPMSLTAVVAVATNLVLNFTMIPAWGGDGAAIATVCSYAALVGMTAAAARRMRVDE